MATILELGTCASYRAAHPTPAHYPYPSKASIPVDFHPHQSYEVLNEDFVMSNSPQIYGMNIFLTWSYTPGLLQVLLSLGSQIIA